MVNITDGSLPMLVIKWSCSLRREITVHTYLWSTLAAVIVKVTSKCVVYF